MKLTLGTADKAARLQAPPFVLAGKPDMAEYLPAETALLPHQAEACAGFAEREGLQQRLDALQRVNRL
ncbi:hypothetical protein AXE65_11020 [Ventosimonas gracilis]|uniref:Uncharacterized protein n=1 Tax=Ventosimonas gracilis TaxID=1680762 RepID=A0A139SWI2_9GAMM|nr:hypothetical protein [Ventosimonas gracilis]KXU38967.1 hypothetical protein AXE65_11020 [Ventosimonas gracilis]